MQHRDDHRAALKCSSVDAVRSHVIVFAAIRSCSPHTSVSPHRSHSSITFSSLALLSSPLPLSSQTPEAFPHLIPLSSLRVLLPPPHPSPSLPRCAKWKLSQRPEVAIVTCHSNHSPSCVSPSHRRGLGASAALLCSSQSGASVQ